MDWYIVGGSDGSIRKSHPLSKFVAYKGHTMQGNYEGTFVYFKKSKLPPPATVPAVREAAANAALDFCKVYPH